MYAAHIGCSTESTWKIVDCLKRSRSYLELGADFKVIYEVLHIYIYIYLHAYIYYLFSLKLVLMLGVQ